MLFTVPEIHYALTPLFSALFFLYAETHYSFKGIYSRLKKPEPEIIVDAPHRLEPGHELPLLLLIKDAHTYPIQLHRVIVEKFYPEAHETQEFEIEREGIDSRFWHRLFSVSLRRDFEGVLPLDVTIQYSVNGVAKQARNDNYARTSHAPLEVMVASQALPKTAGWHFGEFHCHTSFTDDQVEFGAPLAATRQLARVMGLNFFCATDHSYDLDDDPHNYLKKDPLLRKWQALWQEVGALNADNSGFVIVPGEEVSVGNHKNRNVHFLILNNPTFLPGDGDGAERWFRTRPTASIESVLQRSNSNSAAFAAHPLISPPLLERMLVRRGKWEAPDFEHPGLHGMQIWNGSDAGFEEGKRAWINLLLNGRRIFISAGNDAHGNFNRYRQIGFPFLTMQENHHQVFGRVRTAVFVDQQLTLDSLLMAIRNGRMVVTDGPFLDLRIISHDGQTGRPGDTLSGQTLQFDCVCQSSAEFGELQSFKIYAGCFKTKKESLLRNIEAFPAPFLHKDSFVEAKLQPGYVRAELYTERDGQRFKCLTNPVWFNI